MTQSQNFDFENTPVSKMRPSASYRPVSYSAAPVVTVVTPYFNTGQIFEETARSVFQQTFQLWEWIIVDDGSSDEIGLSVLEPYRRHPDSRVRVITHPHNRGLSAARNTGVGAAKAEYLVMLDSDDLLEPTFIEKCLWHLVTHPGVAFTKGYSVGFGAERYLWLNGFHDGSQFLEQNRVDPTSMVRRSVFLKVGGNDESIRGGLEDWDFWLRAADHGYWGDTINEPLNWYRRREGHWSRWQNISSKKNRRKIIDGFRARYGRLWKEGFPTPPAVTHPNKTLRFDFEIQNRLVKERRRALFLLPHLEMGGADRFNLDLMTQLIERFDWEVAVVTTRCSKDPWATAFAALSNDVFMLHRFLHLSDYPRFLSYFIESRRPDVLFLSHSLLGYRLISWIKTAFPSLPIIDLVHIATDEWMSGGYPRLSATLHPFLDRTVATSDFLRKWLVSRGHVSSQVEVCTTNIDSKIWTRTPATVATFTRRWGIKGDRAVILYAARFCDQKQPRLLPGIVKALLARSPHFLLLLAGDGPDRDWLNHNLCRRYPKHTRMLGPIGPGDMLSLMAGTDILLLPSANEGIALVLFEALSMGVVPVATDVGGQSELLTSDCGVLLANGPGLVEETAAAISGLLKEPEKRRRMAARGREKVEAIYTLDRMGDQLHQTFLELIESTARREVTSLDIQESRRHAVTAVRQTLEEQTAENLWDEKMKEGNSFPRVISFLAHCARSLPLAGPMVRRLEQRYGTQLGRMIVRWS